MQVTVNKDLDSYKDDFFKGLTLKQTAISIISVAAGTGTYFFASYVLKLDQTICFYLALPVVLPIAAGGFLRIHGMTPALYLKRRRETVCRDAWFFSPDFCLLEEEGSRIRAKEPYATWKLCPEIIVQAFLHNGLLLIHNCKSKVLYNLCFISIFIADSQSKPGIIL